MVAGAVDHLLQAVGAQHLLLAVLLVDVVLVLQPVPEARGVAHDLAHRRRALHVLQDRAAEVVGAGHHLEVLKLRHIAGDRVVQAPLALFEQDHHRHAGDRLGHRVDAHDRVGRHRRVLREAALAVGLELHDLAMAR
jgi:hypothetical protein